ncbi:MAG: polysaccharide biosynthesis protein [Prevotella sp.]|nr:polysaccharide biosynthesis protein [Prevotella sp.]
MGNINKIANWYFNKKSLPFWCILAIDLFIVFFSYLFVFWFFNGGKETLSVIEYITANILLYLLFYAIGFKFMKTYSGILRYSSFVDLQRIGIASLFGMLCSYLIYVLLDGSYRPLSYVLGRDIVIATILSTLLLWLERIAVKILYDISLASINAKYTFIYGIHEGGVGIAKHIRNEKPMRFLLKGFVSDEKEIENLILMGMHVHPLDEHLIEKMKDEGIEALIVSPLKVNAFRNNEQLQDELIKAGIHIYISQQPQEWNEYDFSRPQLKEISIEDLLPRDEIQVDMESIGKQLADRTVMITGAAGSIGSEMVRQIASLKPKELVLVDQAETPMHDISLMLEKDYPQIKAAVIVTSICNRKRMEDVFCKHRPEYVFHAAAYKHVPIMESNPCESVSNNIFGTKTIADLSVKYQVKKFVMVSTDKAVNPTNVMGCSKRICEIYVQSLDKAIKDGKVAGITQFVTTRFGNVLGSNGSVIPLFEEQIKNGGPVTVTDPNIVRYFMLIPEACKLVLEAGTKGKGGEIFVFDMGKPVKIADLANRMIKLSKAEHVKIQFTGLRPGEKLYEEVLNVEETTKPSFHDKIRIASVREYDYQDVCQHIDSLVLISQQYDDMQTVKKMKEIVPEYKSNNSIFSELDK